MGTEEDRSEIAGRLRTEKQGWRRERLIALKMGFCPGNSVEASAPTVQRWFAAYRKGGLEA